MFFEVFIIGLDDEAPIDIGDAASSIGPWENQDEVDTWGPGWGNINNINEDQRTEDGMGEDQRTGNGIDEDQMTEDTPVQEVYTLVNGEFD